MSNVTLHSFAELAAYFPRLAADDEEPPVVDGGQVGGFGRSEQEQPADGALADLDALLVRLTEAASTLAAITTSEQQARSAAMGGLERYDALTARQEEAATVATKAQDLRRQAEALAARALSDDNRSAAATVLAIATQAERAAAQEVGRYRAEADTLAHDPILSRLLEERQQEAEHQKAEAEEQLRQEQLAAGLAAVRAAQAAGNLEDALAMLGNLAKDHPNSAEVASVHSSIRQQQTVVKTTAILSALRLARGSYRHDPVAAIGRLEGLDLADLPREVVHQVIGVWTAACARLCRERGVLEPRLRYLAQPGHGVIVARERADAPYVVISALGGADHLPVGSTVGEHFVQRAQPLQATGR